MAELVVEIGFEEMPAPWLSGLAEQLRTRFVEAAARELLEAKGASVAWTPRRLVLSAELPARQADREEPVWGPALKVAKDATGAWTPVAQGFAKKNGVAITELLQRPKDAAKPAELNLLFVRKVKGRPTGQLVPGLLAGVLRALAFPKRMSWDAWLEDGRGAFPFGRPIRWLVVLLDGRVVPFQIYALEAGARGRIIVESGAATRGHRFLPKGRGGESVTVSSYRELGEALRERYVILEPGERATRIDGQLRAAASGGAGEGLREEWGDLVEFPTVMVGVGPALPSVQRVMRAECRPVAYLVDSLPINTLQSDALTGEFGGSVLYYLTGSGAELQVSRAAISATNATADVAKALEILRDAVLLQFASQLYDCTGKVVDYSVSYFTPGYFNFHVNRRVGKGIGLEAVRAA